MRRAVAAAPLQTEPRMTLARLLESEGRDAEARAVLVGPLPVAPRDLYLQAWRAVRDHYHDAGFGGADVFALKRAAERRLRTPEDAHAEIDRLLAALDDTWGRRFPPAEFARYLLAPNAGRARRPATPEPARPGTPAAPARRRR